MTNFPFTIETHRNGKKFFEVSRGTSYCDPKFCPTCEAGESHSWDDMDSPGFSNNGLTYTGPDGSVWYGEDYAHDESASFGWYETRYRFWKQDDAEKLLVLIHDLTGEKAEWVSLPKNWVRFPQHWTKDTLFKVLPVSVDWNTLPVENLTPQKGFPATNGMVCSYKLPESCARTGYYLQFQVVHPDELKEIRRQIEDRLRKDERLLLKVAADLSFI